MKNSQSYTADDIKRQRHRPRKHLENLSPTAVSLITLLPGPAAGELLDPLREHHDLVHHPTHRDVAHEVLHREPRVQPRPPDPVRGAVPLEQGPGPGDGPRQLFHLLVADGVPLGHDGLAQGGVGDDGDGLGDQGPEVEVDDLGRLLAVVVVVDGARLGAREVVLPVEDEDAQEEAGQGARVAEVGVADGEEEGDVAQEEGVGLRQGLGENS